MKFKLIDVKDRKNPERLLGRMYFNPTCEVHSGMRVEAAVFPPIDYRVRIKDGYDIRRDIVRATFEVAYRRENNGLLCVAELRTDTPLGVLMMVRGFQLPGETEGDANERYCMRELRRDRGLL